MDDQDFKVLGPSRSDPGAVTKEENSFSIPERESARDSPNAAAAALNGRVAPGVVTNDVENSSCCTFSRLQAPEDDSEATMAVLSRRIDHRLAKAKV